MLCCSLSSRLTDAEAIVARLLLPRCSGCCEVRLVTLLIGSCSHGDAVEALAAQDLSVLLLNVLCTHLPSVKVSRRTATTRGLTKIRAPTDWDWSEPQTRRLGMPKERSDPNRIESACVRKKRPDTVDVIAEKPTYLSQGPSGQYIRALQALLLSTIPGRILGRPVVMGDYDSLL
jgi:hypothetical protein